jgi:hypothetical protein
MKLVVTTVSTQQDYREAVSAVKLFFKKGVKLFTEYYCT